MNDIPQLLYCRFGNSFPLPPTQRVPIIRFVTCLNISEAHHRFKERTLIMTCLFSICLFNPSAPHPLFLYSVHISPPSYRTVNGNSQNRGKVYTRQFVYRSFTRISLSACATLLLLIFPAIKKKNILGNRKL